MITWVLYDRFLNRKISAVNACIGAIVGLVAITPAAAFVSLSHAIVIGFISSLVCNMFLSWIKSKNIVDDTLDVFATHGLGDLVKNLLWLLVHLDQVPKPLFFFQLHSKSIQYFHLKKTFLQQEQ